MTKHHIKNLTPHTITVGGFTFPPSGQVARVEVEYEEDGSLDIDEPVGIPLVRGNYGEVTGLPGEGENVGTVYIVSTMVRKALPGRRDLASPAIPVRDADGVTQGCEALELNQGGGAMSLPLLYTATGKPWRPNRELATAPTPAQREGLALLLIQEEWIDLGQCSMVPAGEPLLLQSWGEWTRHDESYLIMWRGTDEQGRTKTGEFWLSAEGLALWAAKAREQADREEARRADYDARAAKLDLSAFSTADAAAIKQAISLRCGAVSITAGSLSLPDGDKLTPRTDWDKLTRAANQLPDDYGPLGGGHGD